MTVVASGMNYDGLTLLYFDDIELWRSATGMPTQHGIHSTVFKDMTAFSAILREKRKVIFDLTSVHMGNVPSEHPVTLLSNYNVTITALYYNDDNMLGPCQDPDEDEEDEFCLTINPPDVILPISSDRSASGFTSEFWLPDDGPELDGRINLTFPQNVERAVVSVLATGVFEEEYWFKDVPQEFLQTYGNTSFATGRGPWRELQVLIDDQLAGVVWPRPYVLPGGLNPGLWVPVVGIGAFDMQSVDVDVSPWLGKLCDGNPHTFSVKIVTIRDDWASIPAGGPYIWWVSGRVSLWLDEDGEQTTGEVSSLSVPAILYMPGNGPQVLTYVRSCAQ